jgi:hypothetical protein
MMNKLNLGVAIALAVGIGTALGVAFDNIAMGVALGAGFSSILIALRASKNKNHDES